jgi:hypothetical protein
MEIVLKKEVSWLTYDVVHTKKTNEMMMMMPVIVIDETEWTTKKLKLPRKIEERRKYTQRDESRKLELFTDRFFGGSFW